MVGIMNPGAAALFAAVAAMGTESDPGYNIPTEREPAPPVIKHNGKASNRSAKRKAQKLARKKTRRNRKSEARCLTAL
jgi:hypothetical protein